MRTAHPTPTALLREPRPPHSGTKTKNVDETVQVKDLAELVADRLQEPASE